MRSTPEWEVGLILPLGTPRWCTPSHMALTVMAPLCTLYTWSIAFCHLCLQSERLRGRSLECPQAGAQQPGQPQVGKPYPYGTHDVVQVQRKMCLQCVQTVQVSYLTAEAYWFNVPAMLALNALWHVVMISGGHDDLCSCLQTLHNLYFATTARTGT